MSYPGEYHSVEIGHMVKRRVKSLSRVRLLVTPWTIAYQASQTMGFSRQEYWSGLPFPSPGDLLDPGIKPGSPALQADAWAVCVCVCVCSVTQLCPTLCSPVDCSPSGSSVNAIFWARTLVQVVIFYSKGSSWPRDQT